MGDFVGQNRHEVFERLRRRIDLYQGRQRDVEARYQTGYLGVYEQQRQETDLLHQRWLENTAKKAAKQAKSTSKENNSSGGSGGSAAQNNHRNLVTQRIKQKIDATTAANCETSVSATASVTAAAAASGTASGTTADSGVFSFDNDQKPQQQQSNTPGTQGDSKCQTTDGGGSGSSSLNSSTNVGVTGSEQDGSLPHVSVEIVHQISPRKSPQTIHTNVTFNPFPPLPQQPLTDTSLPTHNNNSSSNVNVHTSTKSSIPRTTTSVPNTTPPVGKINTSAGLTAFPNTVSVNTETCAQQTSFECKQEEPPTRDECAQSHLTADSGPVPVLPYDELNDILEHIEKTDLKTQLETFDEIFRKVSEQAESNGSSSTSSLLSFDGRGSPGLSRVAALLVDTLEAPSQPKSGNSVGGDPPTALSPTMFEPAQTMGAMATPGVGRSVRPSPSLVEPTGPAAETLKQMAAQHQYQHTASAVAAFPNKHLAESQYTDHHYDPFGHNRSSYPSSYPSQGFPSVNGAAGYSGYGQNSVYMDNGHPMYPGVKGEVAGMRYGQTKSMSHYPPEGHMPMPAPTGTHSASAQPSVPLQQLQKQVASQFNSPMHMGQAVNDSPSVHLTQQAQMVAAAAARQQQQQLRQQQQQSGVPQGMDMCQQQQVYSMGSHVSGLASKASSPGQLQPAVTVSSSVVAREMNTIQEQLRERHQQQQRQYMNRPPPEYKLHAARAAGAPYQVPSKSVARTNGESSTPLQTMQNMVNKTPPYPVVKGEPGASTGRVMTPVSSVPLSASANGAGLPSGPSSSSSTSTQASQNMAAYQQHLQSAAPTHQAVVPQQQPVPQPTVPQHPPSYSPQARTPTPSSVAMGTPSGGGSAVISTAPLSLPVSTSTTSQLSNHNYTSALMRNQRPPNVNVGPDGLNISQPRTHPGHMVHPGHPHPHAEGWPQVMMQQGQPGHMGYTPHTMQGHMTAGARPQTMQGHVVGGGSPTMQGHMVSRSHHQAMQGHLVNGAHPAMQGHMPNGVAMGASPVSPMGQTAMMPPGYSHRPGSTGSAASAMSPVGHLPGGHAGTHHPMMGAGGMGMGGGQQMMMMHHGMAMSQQQAMVMRGRGAAMTAPHPQPYHTRMMNAVAMQTPMNGSHGQQPPYHMGMGPPDDVLDYLKPDMLNSDFLDNILT